MMAAAGAKRGEPRRRVDGVLLLDKPRGITSHGAMRSAQRHYQAVKAGHTGTLDPLATGLLPVCFGEATKFSHVLLDAEKTYEACVQLGVTTNTGDLEGTVTARAPAAVTRRDVDAVLPRFMGEIMQVPPMHSAIKMRGQPLYRLARAGQVLPRTPRKIVVRELTLLSMTATELELRITCTKGTYVRVLAEEIGHELGCGACLSRLRRTAVGSYTLANGAVTLSQLEEVTLPQRDALLLPPDALVASLPRFDLDADQTRRIARGQAIEKVTALAEGLTRIYGPDQQFLGLAEVTATGCMVPRRLRSQVLAT
ncbi:MAG TPA: tRNA pseudouridine(55) synthase TruB [Burkholderiales bacterium]|nr:tRNA pseudouridine(55) synthase TruB [Burkholderiales bacterium]